MKPIPAENPLWPAPSPAEGRCATCAWHYLGGRGPAVDRCRRHRGEVVDPRWPACPAYTASLDCLTCGACCREAYHSVEVGPRDPFVRLHPDRVSRRDGRLEVTRSGERCGCLAGGPRESPESRGRIPVAEDERLAQPAGSRGYPGSADSFPAASGESTAGAYHCVLYADRPKTCRDFPLGGQSCVEARRRVGLTP